MLARPHAVLGWLHNQPLVTKYACHLSSAADPI